MAPDSLDSLSADVRHLQEDVSGIKTDLREIRDNMLRTDGGRRMLVFVIGSAGGLGGILGAAGAAAAYLGLR